MILIFEQDIRKNGDLPFTWKPGLFRGGWDGKRMWRVWWGLWSVSYYPSPGIRPFIEHVASGKTRWYD